MQSVLLKLEELYILSYFSFRLGANDPGQDTQG
jgi:hypothetical protein